MPTGIITKALSGFYYVTSTEVTVECRGRGRLRLDGLSPLVGDIVDYTADQNGKGSVEFIHRRRNCFSRPAVANIDCMVLLCSAVNPVTDPFLIDRMTVAAENAGCEVIICINKCDLEPGNELYNIYKTTRYTLLRTSAETGEGLDLLRNAIRGKVCAFTGNSGVGKSSLLNRLSPGLDIKVGQVSDKLGRGRHTTRHVELFALDGGAYIADTPGFSSFDFDRDEHIPKEQLRHAFSEFEPFLGKCRFDDCAHISEPGCSILEAVQKGIISPRRHENYVRLYNAAALVKDWEIRKNEH